MVKVKKKGQFVHSTAKLSHAQCREKVCIVCFESKTTRVIDKKEWIDHLKIVVGQNFDINDQRTPNEQFFP